MEEWKYIDGTEQGFMISNEGKVKSLFKGKIMRLTVRGGKSQKEYFSVSLNMNKKSSGHYVHRLVAFHFIPNPENKKEVNHKNGNKRDNRVENLEWVTRKENMEHASENGLFATVMGLAKLNEAKVLEIRKMHSEGISRNIIAEQYQMDKSHIGKIIRKAVWKHI